MTKIIKPALFAICLVAFGSAYARVGYAVGSYYLDAKKNDRSYDDKSYSRGYSNNYSQSEVYASAQQSKKKNKNTYDDAEVNMYSDASKTSSKTTTSSKNNITSNSYVVEGGEGGKKIYNTIIVKTNKNTKNQSKAVKTTNKKTKQKQVIVEEEATDEEEPVKVVKKKRTKKVREDYDNEPMSPEERAELDEEQIEKNKRKKTEEEIDEEFVSETKKKRKKHNRDTTPASWYVYALGGYSMTIPFWSSFETNYANVDVKDKFPTAHGYHFAIGAKFYSWHFFFSPEFLYQRFDTNIYKKENETTNETETINKIHRIYYVDLEGYEDITSKTTTTTNINTRVDISHMIVGGVRVGFTIGNSVSIYGRGNVGLINVRVQSSYVYNQITTIDNYYRQLYGDYENQQIDRIETEGTSHLQNQYSKNNWNMVYGLGGGLEFALLRQHIFFRLEYDYYWLVKSSITLPYKDAEGNDKLTYKGNFGTILFSLGVAF